ncbi:MAG: Long-chain-fatty-acid--CoA ligase [Alphaproteobacteria bacterium MarineAlpha11_Bin1]|nr:MAG: Long-chain-fatty-acid--CoA ligase [Alphaproteobacteria bacterium MarineAlpha11_Bin1]
MSDLAPVNMNSFGVDIERRGDGTIILNCPEPLDELPSSIVAMLRAHAAAHPNRDFLCERDANRKWRRVTYDDVLKAANSIGQALLDSGHGVDRPLAILSDNSIDQAFVIFGCMTVGVPVMPVSPAYSLMSQDHEKLKNVIWHNDPSAIFIENPETFEGAIDALDWSGRTLVTSKGTAGIKGAVSLSEWLSVMPRTALENAASRIDLDTIGKILLTSGSTGLPKGVLNTHRMMVSNQVSIAQIYEFLRDEPPVFLDWLPWNHTFGGNYNFNMVLHNGGTLYIDEGRPVPGLVEATIDNLREISPTLYLNVPRGYDLMLPLLEQDEAARNGLFRNLKKFFFAGAALPANVWERLDALAVEARGERLPITTSLGSTETAPGATYLNWLPESAGNIGLPMPGHEVKLIPNGDKLEIRMRGPNITPGYYKQEDLTKKAFDEENFFCIGDAGKFEDDQDPSKGIVFDGRVAENFKLLSGTWVHAGQLRLQVIAAASPAIQDAVVTGQDQNEVGLLVFPSNAGCQSIAGAGFGLDEVSSSAAVKEHIRGGLMAHNEENPGSSTRIQRVLIMSEPPQIDAGEITDKGYINQRAVLERRAALVDRLYKGDHDDIVIVK